ncbi:MAG: hypothetical protein ACLUVG_06935 [Phocaeicola vulgatus]
MDVSEVAGEKLYLVTVQSNVMARQVRKTIRKREIRCGSYSGHVGYWRYREQACSMIAQWSIYDYANTNPRVIEWYCHQNLLTNSVAEILILLRRVMGRPVIRLCDSQYVGNHARKFII